MNTQSNMHISELSLNEYHVSLFVFDQFKLMFPQSDVISVESVYELKTAGHKSNVLGYIVYATERLPVYCLSDELTALHAVPDDRYQCGVIKSTYTNYALLCKDVKNDVIRPVSIDVMPASMSMPGSPITHLCVYKDGENNNQLGMVSNAEALSRYLHKDLN